MIKLILVIILSINFLLSQNLFGDGSDGYLEVANTVYVDDVKSKISQNSSENEPIVYVQNPNLFEVGQNILIIQMEGENAGQFEEAYAYRK